MEHATSRLAFGSVGISVNYMNPQDAGANCSELHPITQSLTIARKVKNVHSTVAVCTQRYSVLDRVGSTLRKVYDVVAFEIGTISRHEWRRLTAEIAVSPCHTPS